MYRHSSGGSRDQLRSVGLLLNLWLGDKHSLRTYMRNSANLNSLPSVDQETYPAAVSHIYAPKRFPVRDSGCIGRQQIAFGRGRVGETDRNQLKRVVVLIFEPLNARMPPDRA